MRASITPTINLRRSAVAFASVALVATAACDNESVNAPQTPREVTAPTANALVIPPLAQEVTIRFKDVYGNLITDGMMPANWLALSAEGDTLFERISYDNHWNTYLNDDLDPAAGITTIKMPAAARQRVCQYTFTTNYAHDANDWAPCNEKATNGAYKVDLGTLVMRRKPVVTFTMKNSAGTLLPGASIRMTGPIAYDVTITDGGVGDAGGADGKIRFKTDQPGTFTFCEVVPPGAGTYVASPTCGTITLAWEDIKAQTISHILKVRAITP